MAGLTKWTIPAPGDLGPAAAARWREVIPALRQRKAALDVETVRTYCQVWARWREAEDGLASSGQLVRAPNGRTVPSPWLAVAQQAGAQVRALEDRLGIGGVGEALEASRLVSRRELAELLGVHVQTVSKWEAAGLPIADRGGRGRMSRYAIAQVRGWLSARETARAGTLDVAQERARRERAQAVLAEQMYAMRAGTLLPASEVEKTWLAEVAAVRAVVLTTYDQAAEDVYAALAGGLPAVRRALKAIAYRVLRELAGGAAGGKGNRPAA